MQQNVGSSSSYLSSLELVQRENQWFFLTVASLGPIQLPIEPSLSIIVAISTIFLKFTKFLLHTKVDLQFAQCAHRVCAL